MGTLVGRRFRRSVRKEYGEVRAHVGEKDVAKEEYEEVASAVGRKEEVVPEAFGWARTNRRSSH